MGVIAASILVRVLFSRLYLPNTPSQLGPDEGTYALLAGYVAKGLPVQEFPGWGPNLYNNSKSLILPSSALVRLGLEQLEAVRTVSSIYGVLTTFFMALFLVSVSRQNFTILDTKSGTSFVVIPLIFCLFTFLPSNFVWSALGMRESSSQFWSLSFFYFITKMIRESERPSKLLFVFASLSMIFCFSSRKESALVLTLVSLIMTLVMVMRFRKVAALNAVVLGLVGGQMFTATPVVNAKVNFSVVRLDSTKVVSATPSQSAEVVSATPSQSAEVVSATPSQSAEVVSATPSQSAEVVSATTELEKFLGLCKFDNEVLETEFGKVVCKTRSHYSIESLNAVENVKTQLSLVADLNKAENARATNAKSALPPPKCSKSVTDLVSNLACIVQELPYRLASFLFRPILFLDSGSSFFNYAGLENLVWIFMFFLIFYLLLTRKIQNTSRLMVAWLVLYISIFTSLASLYEGNLGTAFRHKSSILWPLGAICFILLVNEKKRTVRSFFFHQKEV
jgi:hypothetical protein